MSSIQIGAVLQHLPGGIPDIHITSPELKVPDEIAQGLITAIDAAGGKAGRLDFVTDVDVPVVFNLFGLHVDRPIALDADAFIQVVETSNAAGNGLIDAAASAIGGELNGKITALEAKLDSLIVALAARVDPASSVAAPAEPPQTSAPVAAPADSQPPVELHEGA